MQKHQISTRSDPTTKSMQAIKRKRNEWRLTKMVLAIFLSFVICYLPITIIKTTDPDVLYPGKYYNKKKINKLVFIIYFFIFFNKTRTIKILRLNNNCTYFMN